MMASYVSKVRQDISRWLAEGLIDAPTAQALRNDIDSRAGGGFSFGGILAVLAALLLGAAILIFVAANWLAFPRVARVGLLFAIILAAHAGGAFLKLVRREAAGEAGFLIGGAAFGGSIALIGQMYHLSGDEAQALLVWCAGVTVAAVILRSAASTVAAVVIAASWLWVEMWDFWSGADVPHEYLLVLAVLWAVSLWTGARSARHLIVLSLVLYASLSYLHTEQLVIPFLLALASTGLFLAATFRPESIERFLRLGGGAQVHGLLGFVAGMSFVQFAVMDEPGFMLAALVTFGASIGALILGGRESRMLRWLAYAVFGVELCIVYVVTVGTMLGTAGFLIATGALLAVLAFVITRFERRMKAPAAQGGAA